MSSRERALERYIKNTLEGNDKDMQRFSMKYRNHYLSQIETLNLNQKTFSSAINVMTRELFSLRSATYPYVMSLLVFSVELDGFCRRIHHSWYTTGILTQTLVHILSKTSFNPPYSYKKCVILYPSFFHFLYSSLWNG